MLVKQCCADRVFPDRADTVRQHQPALLQFDRRSAVADLHELPRELRLQDRLTAFPPVEVVGIDQIEVFVILSRDHGVLAVDPAREERHALVARGSAVQGRHPERQKVAGLDQFRPDRRALVGGIGCVIGRPTVIAELDEARVFDAVRLRFRDRKDHAFTDILLRLEDDLDFVAMRSGHPMPNPGTRSKPGRRIDCNTAVRRDGTSAKRQRRHMAFADGTEAQNKAQAALRNSRLVRVWHDAGIEQRRRFEGIFVQEVGADELALYFGKRTVRQQRLLHFVGPALKRLQQVAMPALEILQHVGQLTGRGLRLEIENALDDMVGTRLVGRVEIARLGRRLERTHDHAPGIGPQIERPPIDKSGL